MTRSPDPGSGQGEQPGRDPGLPGGLPGSGGRDPRLAAFAQGDEMDRFPASDLLATVLSEVSGPDRRCPGATDDELVGILGRWAALESWAAAAKLGVAAELVRRRAEPGHEPTAPGGMPRQWEPGTGHEVAAALAMSLSAADDLIEVAVALASRLPGIAALLANGTIDALKAKILVKELFVLDDAAAARAEALIAAELAGKTPGQIGRLAADAVDRTDPEGAVKRRERAEREDARVRFWRERSGAAVLAGYGLPTDAALSADANIKARARQYKKAKVSPGATMDQLRVLAYLDMLNGVSAAARIAQARAGEQAQDQAGQSGDTDTNDSPHGPGDAAPADGADVSDPGDHAGLVLAASTNLTLPLTTLRGLGHIPGHGHGLGPLDPALVRDLAAAAVRSPHSTWCLTITDPTGIAIGHGCARVIKGKRRHGGPSPPGPPHGPWTLTPRAGDPGPPGGYGAWTLSLPGGREYSVRLHPVPVSDCDHRYATHAYQPGDLLRHLVQIRDGQCTFPSCSRHARDCDFEHAVPYDQGGLTCACNAGARSRRCHKVKQSRGWSVTQPRPGWHQWTAPSGRTYTQGPMKYPA